MAVDTTNGMYGTHAACLFTTAGALVTNSVPLGIASVVRSGAGDYNVTLTEAIDSLVAAPKAVSNGLTARIVTVSQTSDTVFRVLSFNAAAAATDSAVAFVVERMAVG